MFSDVQIPLSGLALADEIREKAKVIAEAQGFSTLVIVSDPLHMRRAMEIADRLDLEAVSSPTPTSRYQSWEPKLSFFLREVYFLSLLRLFPGYLTGMFL